MNRSLLEPKKRISSLTARSEKADRVSPVLSNLSIKLPSITGSVAMIAEPPKICRPQTLRVGAESSLHQSKERCREGSISTKRAHTRHWSFNENRTPAQRFLAARPQALAGGRDRYFSV